MTTIETCFASGSFLASLPASCSTTSSGRLSLTTPVGPKQPSFPYDGPSPWNQCSSLPGELKAMISSSLFTAIPSLASITARILPLLNESSPLEAWSTMEAVVMRLEKVASNVENDWAQSALAGIQNDDDIGMCPIQPHTTTHASYPEYHSTRIPRCCGEYLDYPQNTPFHNYHALAVHPLHNNLHPPCHGLPRTQAIFSTPAHSLDACSVDAPRTLPSLVCDCQVRWGHINEERRLRGAESGVLLCTRRFECGCRGE